MATDLAGWEIWLGDPQGFRVAQASNILSLDCARVINDIGAFALTLPGDFDPRYIIRDGIVEILRNPGAGVARWVSVGFIRAITYAEDARGEDVIILEGPDQNDLLNRRIVAYAAGSAQAEKTDFADDMMKDIIRENMGSGAIAARDWSSYNFGVAADLGAAPSITKGFAWRNVLKVLRDISASSESAGTRLYFDLQPYMATTTQVGFSFITSTEQLGVDRTGADQIIFSKEWGNLSDPELLFDYTREENYIYVGGQGEEAARDIVEVSDSPRIGMSIWNRREAFEDARHVTYSATAELEAVGNAALAAGKPQLRFRGKLLNTPQTRYGIDWEFGDKVVVSYRGFQYDTHIRAVSFHVDKNGEQIFARFEVLE